MWRGGMGLRISPQLGVFAGLLLRSSEDEGVLSYLEPVSGPTVAAGHCWCCSNR